MDSPTLVGKVAIVTGSNSGIGFETVKIFAQHGAHVIMAIRDENRGLAAIDRILAEVPDALLTPILCDLEEFASVRKFCATFIEMNLPLDILVLNAGVNALPYKKTIDGHERTFQVNHLSHFYIVKLLEKQLIVSSPSRVVVVSSESHRLSTIFESKWNEWNESNFISFMAYNDSKLCNILMANQLHRNVHRNNVTVVSCHPGNLVYTNIQRNWWPLRLVYFLAKPFTKTPNQAAASVVHCATSPVVEGKGGIYYNNFQECVPSTAAMNENLANDTWKRCEDMIKHSIEETDSSSQKPSTAL